MTTKPDLTPVSSAIKAPPPIQRLVIRVDQINSASSAALTGGPALYRLIDGQMPICARHLLELGAYRSGLEARAVLTMDQIESLVVEFELRRDDLMTLHGPQDPFLGEERCRMCESPHVDGNLCHNDACAEVLHPQWPSVYCSSTCAHHDA